MNYLRKPFQIFCLLTLMLIFQNCANSSFDSKGEIADSTVGTLVNVDGDCTHDDCPPQDDNDNCTDDNCPPDDGGNNDDDDNNNDDNDGNNDDNDDSNDDCDDDNDNNGNNGNDDGNDNGDTNGSDGGMNYLCVLDITGKSRHVGMIFEQAVYDRNTPFALCMTKNACENIFATKMPVLGAEYRGFCKQNKAGTFQINDGEAQDLVDDFDPNR